VEQSLILLTAGHRLRIFQMAAENISVSKLTNHGVSLLPAYFHLKNTLC